jgi:hypothetical protein
MCLVLMQRTVKALRLLLSHANGSFESYNYVQLRFYRCLMPTALLNLTIALHYCCLMPTALLNLTISI